MDGPGPEWPAMGIGGDGGLDGVLLLLAGHERPSAGPVGFGLRTWISVPASRTVTPSAA
jgi:hypothetical protein